MLTTSELDAIVRDEKSTVRFMQKHDLLPADNETWPCKKCHGATNVYTRRMAARSSADIRQIPTVRCAHRGCQTYHSIRAYNTFFTSIGSDRRCSSNLSLGAILKLVYYWCWGHPADEARAATGRSRETVAHWFGACRDVCARRFDVRAAMGGPGWRGRVDAIPLADGRDGPWVVRASCNRGAVEEQRFFVVARRDFAAVRPVVRHEILPGTAVLSDGPEYRAGLRSLGYDCGTVDRGSTRPADGQGAADVDGRRAIEAAYRGLDMRAVRKAHDADDGKQLRGRLAEAWYRSTVDKHDDAFVGFFRHINSVHRRR